MQRCNFHLIEINSQDLLFEPRIVREFHWSMMTYKQYTHSQMKGPFDGHRDPTVYLRQTKDSDNLSGYSKNFSGLVHHFQTHSSRLDHSYADIRKENS